MTGVGPPAAAMATRPQTTAATNGPAATRTRSTTTVPTSATATIAATAQTSEDVVAGSAPRATPVLPTWATGATVTQPSSRPAVAAGSTRAQPRRSARTSSRCSRARPTAADAVMTKISTWVTYCQTPPKG
ncbi:hypothetical protein ACFQX8_20555 [Klenkia terrae]|uniref:hypothetical protein n=1 Tax=Klenkia terrae TaxID=1052259 RepID=UPI00361D3C17